MVIYKNEFTGLYRMYKDRKGYVWKMGWEDWKASGQSESLTKSLTYYKKVEDIGGL